MIKSSDSPLERLAKNMCRQPSTRFLLNIDKRFGDVHLKDLVSTEANDQRQFRIKGKMVYNFGCDSFLGLDRDPRVQKAIIDGTRRWGTHNGSSRIFYSVEANEIAEQKLAQWLGVEDTLIYPSVTLANMGLIPGVAGRGTLLAVDRLAHSSIHEGSKIAHDNGADLRIFDPCTPEVLEGVLGQAQYEDCVVAVDGVYSMQGCTPPLRELNQVTLAHGGILYVDDAHGTGIFGDHGRGTAIRELGNLNDVIMLGSLSKAASCSRARPPSPSTMPTPCWRTRPS